MDTFRKIQVELASGEKIVGLFAELRRQHVPLIKDHPYIYDCRHPDDDWSSILTIEPHVVVNHSGIFLSKEPVPMDTDFMNTPFAAVVNYSFINV